MLSYTAKKTKYILRTFPESKIKFKRNLWLKKQFSNNVLKMKNDYYNL